MSPVQVEMVAIRVSSSASSSSPTSSPSSFSPHNSPHDENRHPKRDDDVTREEANSTTNDKPRFRFNRFLFDTAHLVSDDNDGGCGGGDDDDLTSLAWLQDVNLLKNIASKPCQRETVSWRSTNRVSDKRATSPPNQSDSPKSQECILIGSRKPRLSFSSLIFMAIESSPEKRLPVRGIYDWMTKNFPYFKDARPGWKNSIRHNLSYNRYFKNSCSIDRSGVRKCSRWFVDPKYRHLLRLALFKSDARGRRDLVACRNKERWINCDDDDDYEDGSNVDLDAASTLANLSCIIGQQVGCQGSMTSQNEIIHFPKSGSSSSPATLQSSLSSPTPLQSSLSSPPSSLTSSQNVKSELTEEVLRWEEEEIPMEPSTIGREFYETTNEIAGGASALYDRSRTMEGINALLGLAAASE